MSAWLDDGTIVYVDGSGGLSRVESSGGHERGRPIATVAALGGRTIATLWPLPGSRGVLVTSCGGNCESSPTAEVFDLHADTLIVLVPEAIGPLYVPSGQLLFTSVAGGLMPSDLTRTHSGRPPAPRP